STGAGSAPAMARSTTPPAASAKARRPRTCTCRTTPSFPTPRSRSADIQMSGHSTYEPKTAIERWLDTRLPIVRFGVDLMHFPTQKNLTYWRTFGGILAFCLATQIVTGIILAMHYTPTADGAFNSVEHMMRDVNYGWLIRFIHANGASMFFMAVYIHMF